MFSKNLFFTKPNLLWSLLNVFELLTPCKICFTLGLFSNYFSQRSGGGGEGGVGVADFSLKSLSRSLKTHMNQRAIKSTDLWITSLLFDLNY